MGGFKAPLNIRIYFLILFTSIAFLQGCYQREGIYYIIRHPERIPIQKTEDGAPIPLAPPPGPFYGRLTFILLDTAIFYHRNFYADEYSMCSTGKDFSKPPFIGLIPDSIRKINADGLEKFLDSHITDDIHNYSQWDPFYPCIASPTDTIRNGTFNTIMDYFKKMDIQSYNIRNWTEEEQYATLAKLQKRTYDPLNINWIIGFSGEFNASAPPSDKCNIEMVSAVNDHIDSLTYEIVYAFLSTFDSTCDNNVEYSQYSNETLFKVLETAATLFFQVTSKENVDHNEILKTIESPIHDGIDLQKVYNKMKSASAPSDIKSGYMKAIMAAGEKANLSIRK